jgi:hypothetical protein
VKLKLLFCLVAASCLASCATTPLLEVPDGAFFVAANAREVRRVPEYDGAIHYIVDDPYPGEVTVANIESAMRKGGWRASETSMLELGRGDGGRTWWTYHRQPNTKVYQWDAGWSNDSGDLVTYLLRYEVSPPNAVARNLLVSAIYTKAATVKKLREAASMK